MLLGMLTLSSVSNKIAEGAFEPANHCTHVTYSCGVQEDICNFTGTTKQLIAHIWVSDGSICNQEGPEPFYFI